VLSLGDRIELLEQDLRAVPPGFIMSSDLPFAIFRYDPSHPDESEWRLRREIQLLATRIQNTTSKRIHVVSLAKLYWRSNEESEGVEAVAQLERERGFRAAERQVNSYLADPDWRPLPALLIEESKAMWPAADIMFLYRAGVFAPTSYRVSSLLEQMMGRLKVPSVLFYPGTWKGSLNYMGLRADDEPLGSYRVKIYGRDT